MGVNVNVCHFVCQSVITRAPEREKIGIIDCESHDQCPNSADSHDLVVTQIGLVAF